MKLLGWTPGRRSKTAIGVALLVIASGAVWLVAWGLVDFVPRYFLPGLFAGAWFFHAPRKRLGLRGLPAGRRPGPRWLRAARNAVVGAVLAGTRFLRQLGRAVVPLLLLVVVVLFFTSAGDEWWKQVLYGMLSAAIVMLVAPWDEDDTHQALAWLEELGERRKAAAVLVVVIAASLAALVFGLLQTRWSTTIDRFEQVGGATTLLATLAIIVVAVGVLFRLFAVAVSPLRGLVVVDLVASIVIIVVKIGLLPGGGGFIEHVAWWMLASVFAVLVLWVGVSEARDGSGAESVGAPDEPDAESELAHASFASRTRPARARLEAFGLALAGIGAFAFVVAVLYGSLSAADTAKAFDRWGAGRHGVPVISLQNLSDGALAVRFAPVLEFTKDEKWALGNATAFARNRKVVRTSTLKKVADNAMNRRLIAARCPVGTMSCSITCRATMPAKTPPSVDRCARPSRAGAGRRIRGVVYARVLRRSRSGDRLAFDAPSPFGRRLRALVEYWLFYSYDRWEAPTVAGVLVQQHEGDWEAVTVGLGARHPLFVAYTQHCGGQWLKWQGVDVVRAVDPRWRYTGGARNPIFHPLVAVAEGSHANYPQAWAGRAPAWGSCGVHVSRESAAALSYALNVRDKTSDYSAVTPRSVRVVTANTPEMAFPGHWGPLGRVLLANFRRPDRSIGDPEPGPTSPSFHALWSDPVHEIFCNREWRPKGRCKDPSPALHTGGASGMALGTVGFGQLFGAASFGLVLGWCLSWIFLRSRTGMKDLALVVATIGGGALTKLFPDRLFGYYCIGVGVGFLASFVFVVLIAWLNPLLWARLQPGDAPGPGGGPAAPSETTHPACDPDTG